MTQMHADRELPITNYELQRLSVGPVGRADPSGAGVPQWGGRPCPPVRHRATCGTGFQPVKARRLRGADHPIRTIPTRAVKPRDSGPAGTRTDTNGTATLNHCVLTTETRRARSGLDGCVAPLGGREKPGQSRRRKPADPPTSACHQACARCSEQCPPPGLSFTPLDCHLPLWVVVVRGSCYPELSPIPRPLEKRTCPTTPAEMPTRSPTTRFAG